MAYPREMVAMLHLQAYLRALGGQSLLGLSIHQLRQDRDQLLRPGGIRVSPCHPRLLALRLRSLGLKARAGTSPVGVGVGVNPSHHRQRGGHPQVVSQRWGRCHPHLPTGWMRNGLLQSLKPGLKSPSGNGPRLVARIRPGGLMTAQSLSLQTARTLL